MIRTLLIALLFFVSSLAWSKTIRVAVIDTGYTHPENGEKAKICKDGHLDLTSMNRQDVIGRDETLFKNHGTNITHIISDVAGDGDFCIVVIKAFRPAVENITSISNAVAHATRLGVDIINISAGGESEVPQETIEIKKALDKGIVVISAAGNKGLRLKTLEPKRELAETLKDGEVEGSYFPAMSDPRIIVVGSLNKDGSRASHSNYGASVDVWQLGEKVYGGGIYMSGTSQATAVHTGIVVKSMIESISREKLRKKKEKKNAVKARN
jgi:hypothetical protein